MTDVLLTLMTLALLAAVILPKFARAKVRVCGIGCVSKLKQISLGFRIWSNDNEDRFPWAVPAIEGGTLEYATTTQVFLHFQAVSNELSTPKILVCEKDFKRTRSSDWSVFNNSNLSYFIGLDAQETDPSSILSGDRNLSTNGVGLSGGIFNLTTNLQMGWTTSIHTNAGNIGLADGSVQQVNKGALQKHLQAGLLRTNRFAVP